jgi:predicted membrane protein
VAETKREEHFRSFERKVKIFASIAVSLSLLFAILSVDIYNIDSLGWIDQDDEGLPWQLVLSMTAAVAALSGLVAALLTRPSLDQDSNAEA